MRIALHIPWPADEAATADLLRHRGAQVRQYRDGAALCAALAAGAPPDVAATTLRDADGRSLAPLLRRLRARFPAVPVVVYGSLSPQTAGDIMEAARLGVAAAALRGHDDLAAVVHRVASATAARRVVDAALGAVGEHLTPGTLPVVRYCLEHAHTVPAVERIAAALLVSRKTMAARLAAAGLPPASVLVSWGRVLLASRWLEDTGRPVERVALALGFDSGTALRHMLARYTGLRTSEIRAQGGLAGVLPLFVAAVEVGACDGAGLDDGMDASRRRRAG